MSRTRTLCVSSSCLALMAASLGNLAHAQSAEELIIELDPIIVTDDAADAAVVLTGEDPADTGRIIVSSESVETRVDTSGDAVTALTSLPTVQYVNNSEEADDQGENADNVLDQRPLEVSISGAAITENNFMIDGFGINTVSAYGPETHDGGEDLARQTRVFGLTEYRTFYGLSSQAQFVPADMVEEVDVQDSNVSAQYGGFQGGVVNYKLKQADLQGDGDWHGKVSMTYQSDKLVEYKLGTPEGDNPDDVAKPEWSRLGFSINAERKVDENTALFFGLSTRIAQADKELDEQYNIDGETTIVDQDSVNNFYRFGMRKQLENGTLTGSLNITDYGQEWQNPAVYDQFMTVGTQSYLAALQYDGSLDILGGADLTLKGSYSHSSGFNDGGENEAYLFQATDHIDSSTYGYYEMTTDEFSDWCQIPDDWTDADSDIICYRGGLGYKELEDKTFKISFELDGALGRGTYKMGGGLEWTRASRNSTGATYYSGLTTMANIEYNNARYGDPLFDGFVCADGDETCSETQYINSYTQYDAYDTTVDATKIDLYAETHQEWNAFEVRAGLRLDYNDYLENVNIAPRLTTTYAPSERFSLTFGANRYYSGDYISYAIHDNIGARTVYDRDYDETTGEVGDWYVDRVYDPYNYANSDVDTPYNDELTLAASFVDGWNGNWRFKLLNREGKDQFAEDPDENLLTNDGYSTYNSFSVEYAKNWNNLSIKGLDSLGLHVSGVYAERDVSNNSFFEDVVEDEFIYYNGTTYTESNFEGVTANLDIPVRMTVALNSTWMNGKLKAGLAGDITFAYDGVRGTGDDADELGITAIYDGQDVSGDAEVYEDYAYDTVLTLSANVSYQIAKIKGNPFMVDFKVSNLMNDVGNAVSDDDNPWVRGRSFQFGASYQW